MSEDMKVNSRRRKIGGGYQGIWNVRSLFEKLDGQVRVVAESEDLPGLLHIFSPGQLVPVRDDDPVDDA